VRICTLSTTKKSSPDFFSTRMPFIFMLVRVFLVESCNVSSLFLHIVVFIYYSNPHKLGKRERATENKKEKEVFYLLLYLFDLCKCKEDERRSLPYYGWYCYVAFYVAQRVELEKRFTSTWFFFLSLSLLSRL